MSNAACVMLNFHVCMTAKMTVDTTLRLNNTLSFLGEGGILWLFENSVLGTTYTDEKLLDIDHMEISE